MSLKYTENFGGTTPFSDTCAQIHCVANVDLDWTVPGVAGQLYQAVFSYASDSNVYVCKNDVAVIPAGGTVEEQPYNEFKPYKRYVRTGDVLHFITPDTSAYIGVSLMVLPS